MVTTTGKKGYAVAVKNIYGVPPPSLEEHHKAIDNLQNIVKRMQTQSYDLEGMAQANSFLTSSNSVVITKLAHMTVTVKNMQAQLKELSSATKKPTRTKRIF